MDDGSKGINIEQVTSPSAEDVEAINSLLGQLSPNKERKSMKMVSSVARDSTLLSARDSGSGKIVGIATLTDSRKLTAHFGTIEDVVVDEGYRRQGVATRLIESLLEIARDKQIKFVELTSNPSRGEANRLYPKLGFKERKTNVYRVSLATPPRVS